jgi:hypothetical protein
MHICDICFKQIKDGDICEECKERKPAIKWIEEYGVSDKEVINRFLELIKTKEENIDKIVYELKKKIKENEVI